MMMHVRDFCSLLLVVLSLSDAFFISPTQTIGVAPALKLQFFPQQLGRYNNDLKKRHATHTCSTCSMLKDGPSKPKTLTSLSSSTNDNNDNENVLTKMSNAIVSNPTRSLSFTALITLCGAALGPFLDSYHSAFGVLQYDEPISFQLWGIDPTHPALITAWWVPELFGLAGFIIGWLYILLDAGFDTPVEKKTPSPPEILVGISFFTLQYWLSGIMYASGYDRTSILAVMTVLSVGGFLKFDNTKAGFITSLATAVGGPLIEVGLITFLVGHGGYHYTDSGETGFFPLWIVPVYFLGGPAVGNLSRGIWNALKTTESDVQAAGGEIQ